MLDPLSKKQDPGDRTLRFPGEGSRRPILPLEQAACRKPCRGLGSPRNHSHPPTERKYRLEAQEPRNHVQGTPPGLRAASPVELNIEPCASLHVLRRPPARPRPQPRGAYAKRCHFGRARYPSPRSLCISGCRLKDWPLASTSAPRTRASATGKMSASRSSPTTRATAPPRPVSSPLMTPPRDPPAMHFPAPFKPRVPARRCRLHRLGAPHRRRRQEPVRHEPVQHGLRRQAPDRPQVR
jgi:hypothetical protein